MKTLGERFWAKVHKTPTCWLWVASVDGHGYGKIQTGTLAKPKYEQAHRVAWRLTHGEDATKNVLHRCDVRLCVRPDHLFEGSTQDNHDDMWAKGRGRHGARASSAKLDADKVAAIRSAVEAGASLSSQARLYGVAVPTIWKVVHRQSWTRPD